MKKVTMSVAALTIAISSYGQTNDYNTCSNILENDNKCKNKVKFVEENDEQYPLCYLHNPNYVKKSDVESTQCNGTSKSTNKQCRRNTKHSSGFCHNHRNIN